MVSGFDTNVLQELADQIASLINEMLRLEAALLKEPLKLHEAHRQSARNLAHYLALRRNDIRKLQSQLALIGLSSLGRTESHVLDAVQAVQRVLGVLLGSNSELLTSTIVTAGFEEGDRILELNTDALLGAPPAGRRVRIMVTMATDAATDYELVRDLVRSGMDCMRINCAHDNPAIWLAMIRNLERAREETGRSCKILMDVAGPKLRTGPIEPGPAVIKCRPKRDVYGRVVSLVRIWLTPEDNPEAAPEEASASLPVPAAFLMHLDAGDKVVFRDARRPHRSLRVSSACGRSCWAETQQTIYFVPGIRLRKVTEAKSGTHVAHDEAHIGNLPPVAQPLLLKQGDTLIVTRTNEMGRPAVHDEAGHIAVPARIGVSLPEVLEHTKPGESIWFDDGKIGGVIREVHTDSVRVEITQARPEGEKLASEKGINLPDTRIEIPALTVEDLEVLKFVVQHADLVGHSFVRTERDVRQLQDHLEATGGKHLGIVLKIETLRAFENLPKLILAAMRTRSFGIMIARGDLAVECGYQRLAEVQEEILWICEAAHVPVIWATQVLETLAKKGMPSRSEITDAAMGERAECVMLNKGKYAVACVSVLADILRRMEAHQQKKRTMLRRLRVAASFASMD
jgi:pyruvate kinase